MIQITNMLSQVYRYAMMGEKMFGLCEQLYYETLAVFFLEILASLAHTTIQILVLPSA